MPNDPQADLIYAILAMDAYNRGYGSGINGLASAGSIGSWELLPDSESRPSIIGGKGAGFYAIAYRNTATGEVVISYRGTDAKALGNSEIGGSDPANSYGLGHRLIMAQPDPD